LQAPCTFVATARIRSQLTEQAGNPSPYFARPHGPWSLSPAAKGFFVTANVSFP
jgi:hypothetical protein